MVGLVIKIGLYLACLRVVKGIYQELVNATFKAIWLEIKLESTISSDENVFSPSNQPPRENTI